MSLRETQWEAVLTASNRNLTKPDALCEHTNCTAVPFSCIGQGEFTLLLHAVVSFSSLPPQDLHTKNDTGAKPEFSRFTYFHFLRGLINRGKQRKCTPNLNMGQ